MMGGMLSWLFVLQAIMVGVLFLGINYYIWQSLARLQGGERYHPYFKAILFALMVCFLVWFTPHTIAMSASEMKAMGAAQHPVIGQFGVMSAKNGAINVMICLTALSYILYRRANRVLTVSWAPKGNVLLLLLFFMGTANIVWLAIYGFYIPANVRVGLSSASRDDDRYCGCWRDIVESIVVARRSYYTGLFIGGELPRVGLLHCLSWLPRFRG